MKTFLSSVFVFVFVVSSWFTANFFLFTAQRQTHQVLMAKIEDNNCIKNELEQIQKQTNYQAKYANIVRTEQEFLENEVPKTAEISSVLAILGKLANEANVSLHDFQVGKTHARGVWFETPVRVTLTADFLPLTDFLEKINLSDRLIVVQDLQYGDTQAELELLVYFGNWPSTKEPMRSAASNYHHCGDYVIPAKIDSVLTTTQRRTLVHKWDRNPFVLPENIPSLANIHLVGIIWLENNTWIALLEDDKGVGRIVQAGSPVVDEFVVQRIGPNSVSVIKEGQTRQLKWSN